MIQRKMQYITRNFMITSLNNAYIKNIRSPYSFISLGLLGLAGG